MSNLCVGSSMDSGVGHNSGLVLYTYQWYAPPPIPGAWWEIGGELTCPRPNGTTPHTWDIILHTIPLHIPYKYLISPCCGQCVTGRYGCLDVTILTTYPALGEDSDGKSPSFLQHLPQVCQVGWATIPTQWSLICSFMCYCLKWDCNAY